MQPVMVSINQLAPTCVYRSARVTTISELGQSSSFLVRSKQGTVGPDPSDLNQKQHYQPVDHFLFIHVILSRPDDSKSELHRISQTGSSEPSGDTDWKYVPYSSLMSLDPACPWVSMRYHLVTTQT